MDKTICERTVVAINILIAIIVFGVIVLVHEFGHYIVAVKNGILVEEFAIGMGPKLVGIQRGDTLYSIRILPIGGFCKMLGEAEESKDNRSFSQKSVAARMAVIFAGPLFNFILAFILIFLVALGGYASTTIDTVSEGSAAEEVGIQSGDQIISYDGARINNFLDLRFAVTMTGQKEVAVNVLRDGEKMEFNVKPKQDAETKALQIGITPLIKSDALGAAKEGFTKIGTYIKFTFKSLWMLITGQVSTNQLLGPIGIIGELGNAYERGMEESFKVAVLSVVGFTIMLSVNLGALNLFPIPALDGCRILFLAVEAVRGKPMRESVENTINLVGFALLMAFMVFVTYNDIVRNLFTK